MFDRYPSNITHLKLGNIITPIATNPYFAKVTHLTFSDYFNMSIKNCVPPSVKYLKFGLHFRQSLDSVPSFVLQIEVHSGYNMKVSEEIIAKMIKY
jgi:hypothetical protein